MKELLKGTTAYKILEGDIISGRLTHAYMLDFPDSKNLREAAKFFATRIFKSNESRVLNESFPDCKIYPAEGQKLDVSTVNGILDDSAMRPVEGDKKLYIIVGFEQASALLQNKLLKTLEEPLEGIYFLLGVTSVAPVLDTVKSRVKLLEIPPFTERQIYSALERQGENELNAAAARSANGVLGVAQSMVSGGWFEGVFKAARELCSITRAGDAGAAALKYGDTKYKNELLSEMQRLYFEALKGGTKLLLCEPALIYALESIPEAFAEVKFNANFQGLLYDFILRVVKENDKWQKLRQ